jgi:hypothetical protein
MVYSGAWGKLRSRKSRDTVPLMLIAPPAGTRQTVSKMKWACLATPLLLLVGGVVEGRQVEVEDVTARQLEAATQTEDVLAVFWCKYTS